MKDNEYLARRVFNLQRHLNDTLQKVLDRDELILDLLRGCQLGLETARDNYTGTEGRVGFGKYVIPIFETAIVRAEKCLNG